jgi:long-chain acyl-CoA synthetase
MAAKVIQFKKALALGERKQLKRPARPRWTRIAFLQYTGGTTGLSKGAVLTHRNIVAATLQAEAWFTPALAKVGDLTKANSIAALPLYHIFALTLCLLAIRQGSQPDADSQPARHSQVHRRCSRNAPSTCCPL